MRVLCAFCFYHTEIEEDDRDMVCENCGIAMTVYEDENTGLMREEVL